MMARRTYTRLLILLAAGSQACVQQTCSELYSELFAELGKPAQLACATDGDCVMFYTEIRRAGDICYEGGCGAALTAASADAYQSYLAEDARLSRTCEALLAGSCQQQQPGGACEPGTARCIDAHCTVTYD